jgi:hypothetical protein
MNIYDTSLFKIPNEQLKLTMGEKLKYKLCMVNIITFYTVKKYLNKSFRPITITNLKTLQYMAHYLLHLKKFPQPSLVLLTEGN